MLQAFRRIRSLAVGAALLGCGQAAPPATSAAAASRGPGADAARDFLYALPDSTRGVATLPFDETERSRWFFVPTEQVPRGRAGLPLKRMPPEAREAAWRLLGSGLSASGFQTARAIVENEALLGQLEDAAGTRRWARDPELYFVSIFGTPSGADPWGWRFEGHHLSVHVTGTGAGGEVIAPVFMGANPHRVPSGPRAGARLLAAEEDVARQLLALLTPAQRARVIVADTTYGEMRTRNDPKARPLPLEGLPASEMTPPQQSKLRELLQVYAGRFPAAVARAQLERIEAAGFGQLRFVWAGSTEQGPGRAHYYRIHGPTVLVEYDNSQNNANHSHTVWRDLQNDFGGDLLRRHYQRHAHGH